MIDDEKKPDAEYQVTYYGVSLGSRYGKRAEHDNMMDIVDDIANRAPYLIPVVESIFCDSKCQANFSVTCVRQTKGYELERIKDIVHETLMRKGGHNGVWVTNGDRKFEINPDWNE